ncbi:ZIP family metal transporter [Bordetella genomosp. 7]|jgi:ZIP family zinc transporter|uniref:ZIP family metal transporter n=1 Tax=Bordetella genomosp. 7 TaxID=1416805 RepID=A0A261RK55_9BORD|nr:MULTISPECIES: ZIP family metal transporter [Bordetella]OZI24183.1 ZIP family metal transporter [Bordetella genomosp. 7]OZI25167.1 ZIP family metal transporter [Bordetella genomosp. 7]
MDTTQTVAREWRAAWRAQAQSRPFVALGLAAASAAALLLLAAGLYRGLTGVEPGYIRYAALGGLAGFGATAVGALLAVGLRSIQDRTQDIMLGFAAGMMLAASAFSLVLPGLAAAEGLVGDGPAAAAVVVLGLALGVLLMLGLDVFTPHAHDSTGPCGPDAERLNRVWLFVLAITLHNLPEGMAIGVGFANGDMQVGLPLTSAISIQNIPEGLAVAMALRATGLSPWRAALVAAASGLMEPLGAMVGLGMSSGLALAYPVSMGLAAGAMIFVVSHEVIPETHRNGHQTPATVGLLAGFAAMMFLDTALG